MKLPVLYEMKVVKYGHGAVIRYNDDGSKDRLAVCFSQQEAQCIANELNRLLNSIPMTESIK
jgi:hypothetical protein